MKLSPRLEAVAEAAGKCSVLADIGTDHCYIPVYMLSRGMCKKAYASDINEKPLLRAVSTVKEYGFEENVDFFLGNGIVNIPEDYDVLVIAGMGGETIVSILEGKRPPKSSKLVLQPMTEERTLRKYLYTHGYSIESETAVSEPGHVYVIITAVCVPTDSFCDRDVFASPAFCSRRSYDSELYIMKCIRTESRILDGLKASLSPCPEIVASTKKKLDDLHDILQLVKI